ncbi:MAG: InlB B-repeat-containing protein [Clostridia bacterium]|nr:InlB B-repeat-containing protein [Clostridia bacterium]
MKMTKNAFKPLVISLTAVLLLVLALLCIDSSAEKKAITENEPCIELLSEEEVTLISKGESNRYKIIYVSDAENGDNALAVDLRKKIYSTLKVNLTLNFDTDARESEHEILLGNTNRAISAELYDIVSAAANAGEYLAAAIMYADGKLAFVASSTEAYEYYSDMIFDFISEDGFTVPSDLFILNTKLYSEYLEDKKAAEEAEKEAARQKRIDELLAIQAAFTQEQFGEYKPMIGENGYYQTNPYEDPWVYPVYGQHPRLFINEWDLDTIREILADPEYAGLAENFWSLANDDINNGVLEDTVHKPSGKIYRYNYHYNHCMVAKALAYLLTGDEIYALEAIVGIKNSMLTFFMIPEVDADTYAGASNILYALSFVYDWCHDYLTDADKAQIIAGVPNHIFTELEFSYPPTNMSYVNGHGTGPQFLRDFMVMANAFADECPDWWDLIVGRYFEQYFPVGDATFGKGWVSQGTANYAYNKLSTQLKSTVSIYTATGEIFFDSEANESAYFLMSHTMPRTGLFFPTGDGGRTPDGSYRAWEYGPYLLAAALYRDPTMFAYAKDHSEGFTIYRSTSITAPSPALILALMSLYLRDAEDTGENPYDKIDTIQYFDFPAGQMTARDSWTDDAAVVLMKIGNLTMANHDNHDYGTFQIYYKGLLACSSGAYKHYGGNTHMYYLQATVSSNGLLVFNPSLSGDDPAKPQTYFYSGGQRTKVDPKNLDQLLNGDCTMGTTIGASLGYTNDGKAEYGYIAGDLTNAYAENTVKYLSRSMLTLYTGDADFPMLFFTYDTITPVDPEFERTYLLHTVKEPEIDEATLSATIVEGDGKMHVQSLFGAMEFEKIGGPGKAYWINGKNCVDEYNDDDSADVIWGRIEYRASGEETTRMLTAMYVTDADNEKTLDIDKYESDDFHAAAFSDKIVLFAKSEEELIYKESSINIDRQGLCKYYVSGVESGTWNVCVDGIRVAHAYASEGEGFITFTAPAGEIVLTPGTDVIGANGGKIQYSTGGGILPADAPFFYNNDYEVFLPETLTKDDGTFLGWYTSPTFEPETLVTKVPQGIKGTFRVYAKWLNIYIDENFEGRSLYAYEKNATIGRITTDGSSKPGSIYEIKTDENNVSYLHWTKGTKDSSLGVNGGTSGIHTSAADDLCISFTLKLGRDADKPVSKSVIRLIANTDVNGVALSSTSKLEFFNITNDGVINCKGSQVATLEAGKITTLRFVVDFANLEIRVHDEDYNHIVTKTFTLPKANGATTGAEFMKCFQRRILHIYGNTDAENPDSTLRIYGIRVEDTDVLTPNIPVLEKPIVYDLGGGVLPFDAPRSFSETESVKLPIPMKANSQFLGWYTTPTFKASSKIEEIPPTSADEFKVYAKWYTVIYEEDYTETEVDVTEASKSVSGIGYNASGKAGATYVTKTDEKGIKYLSWINGTNDPALSIVGTGNNLTNTTASEISFTFTFAKEPGKEMPNLETQFVAGVDVLGNKLSPTGKVNLFATKDGKVYLNGKTEFATVTEEPTVIRIAVDFERLEMRAYDESGEVIASNSFSIPATTKATTGKELMTCFNSRILNVRGNTASDERAFRIYGVKITEGDEFKVVYENSIEYVTDGGELPTDAPKQYSKTEETLLPIPTKNGSVFAGWYTSPTFEESTRISAIPTDANDDPFIVYAKWNNTIFSEDYTESEIDVTETSKNVSGIGYNASGKAGASFVTKTDEKGIKYLSWINGTNDPAISIVGTGSNLTNTTASEISFTFVFAKEQGKEMPNLEALFVAGIDVSGNKLSPTSKISLFATRDGKVYLNGKTEFATVTEEPTVIRIAVDFERLEMRAYDEAGEVIASNSFSIPAATNAATGKELMKCFNSRILNIRGVSAVDERAFRVYGINITEGDVFKK